MSEKATEVDAAVVRIPERAGMALVAALQRVQEAQVASTAAVQLVADALDVPQGWVLGGDDTGLHFAPPPGESSRKPEVATVTPVGAALA